MQVTGKNCPKKSKAGVATEKALGKEFWELLAKLGIDTINIELKDGIEIDINRQKKEALSTAIDRA